ncbi:hypothetical protein BABA_25271 [Neobacillus bataviensis LMG 21833]|uniref:Na+-translocating membrane potential-generating system MpsC domain-containing protein n=1 Tax=Neobacillus bataviensis LMG 21833 TaxID=1117379 RepID=K6DPB7_9BACI|nr:hypothetical protein BABA_25271 [Neobacillus bataviensis LMG 21833]
MFFIIKHTDPKTFEAEFLSFVNNYVKKQGGKGPKSAEVRFMGDTIVYFLRGILTERERKLIQSPEGKRVVIESRRVFLDMDKEHRIAKFEEFLGCRVLENYESWNLENDSATAVLLLEKNMWKSS